MMLLSSTTDGIVCSHWIFSQDEADVWAALIPRAIADAQILSVSPNTVLETIIQRAFIDTK